MKRFLAALLTFCLYCPLRAQDVPARTEEEVKRRLEAQKKVLGTASAAMKAAIKEDFEQVTYEEVMADPDNIGLNFRYARTLLVKGEVLKAAATLERILLVNPRLSRLRLFYVGVLLQLDNLDDAKRELTTLTEQKLTPSMRKELEGYLEQIAKRRKRTRVGVSLSAGLDVDDNRNSAPSSGQRLVSDVPITLDEASTRKSDSSKTMSLGLNVSRDLGYQEGHAVFASLSYYRAEQTLNKALNIQSYNGSVGGTYNAPWASFTPSMSVGHLLLAQTTYQRSWGPSLRVDKKLSPRLNVFLTAGHERELYSRTQIVPTGDQRTGDQVTGGAGFGYALTRTASLTAAYVHTRQNANEPIYAYDREALSLSLTKIFNKGRFALFSFAPQLDQYRAADRTISARIRQDHTYRANATFGTPLGFLTPALDPFLMTFAYEYFVARSNIPNNAFTDNKLSMNLTYRLEL